MIRQTFPPCLSQKDGICSGFGVVVETAGIEPALYSRRDSLEEWAA